MSAKHFRILSLLVLLLLAMACGFPLDPGLGSGSSPTFTSTPGSASDIADGLDEEPASPSRTLPAAEEGAPTATLSPTPDLLVFISPQIISLQMFSPDRGWGVADDGSRLLATRDGGATWLDVTPPECLSLPSGVTSLGLRPFFLDEQTAWFTPSTTAMTTLYHTLDGGQTWLTVDLPFERASYFFLDSENGFALADLGAGAGLHYVALYRTTDGGGSWMKVFAHAPGETKSLPESGTKNGVSFINPNRGFIGGSIPMEDHFYFYVSDTGGAAWSQETELRLPDAFSGSFLDTWQPDFFDAVTGILPVRAAGSDGSPLLIYRSEDAGETWTFMGSVPDGQDVDFITGRLGWIAGEAGLFRTADGGTTWTPAPTPGIPVREDFLQVDFVDEDHGWVLTYLEDGSEIFHKLYRTTDGGETWALLQP